MSFPSVGPSDPHERLWKTLVPRLDDALKPLGYYATTLTYKREYVGTIDHGERQTEASLRDLGGTRPILQSLHVRDVPEYVDDPESITGKGGRQAEDAAFVFRESRFAAFQLHVIVYSNADGTTDLYAHWERNPWASPVRHYRGDGATAAEGVRRARLRFTDEFDWVRPPNGARGSGGE